MVKRKTTPGLVTPVLNMFKTSNPIAKQTLVVRSAFLYGQSSTWEKPILELKLRKQ